MKIDNACYGLAFFIVSACCTAGIVMLHTAGHGVQEEVIEKPAYFIHIDDNSGFLTSSSVMASFEMFKDTGGDCFYWMRVERYGFDKAHEFSVDTYQEAETILRGLSDARL